MKQNYSLKDAFKSLEEIEDKVIETSIVINGPLTEGYVEPSTDDHKDANVRVFNINWETDGNDIELPNEFFLELSKEELSDSEHIEETISNLLSDQTGWLVNSFEFENLLEKLNNVNSEKPLKEEIFSLTDDEGLKDIEEFQKEEDEETPELTVVDTNADEIDEVASNEDAAGSFVFTCDKCGENIFRTLDDLKTNGYERVDDTLFRLKNKDINMGEFYHCTKCGNDTFTGNKQIVLADVDSEVEGRPTEEENSVEDVEPAQESEFVPDESTENDLVVEESLNEKQTLVEKPIGLDSGEFIPDNEIGVMHQMDDGTFAGVRRTPGKPVEKVVGNNKDINKDNNIISKVSRMDPNQRKQVYNSIKNVSSSNKTAEESLNENKETLNEESAGEDKLDKLAGEIETELNNANIDWTDIVDNDTYVSITGIPEEQLEDAQATLKNQLEISSEINNNELVIKDINEVLKQRFSEALVETPIEALIKRLREEGLDCDISASDGETYWITFEDDNQEKLSRADDIICSAVGENYEWKIRSEAPVREREPECKVWFNDETEEPQEESLEEEKSLDESISKKAIKDNLISMKAENSEITEDEIEQLVNEIYEVAKKEEMETGETYKSVEDLDIGGLFDSSTEGNIHNLGYKLLGFNDNEDEFDDVTITDIEEESLDKAISKQLSKMYENFGSYKTETAFLKDVENRIVLEGKLTFTTNKEQNVKFILEAVESDNGKIKFNVTCEDFKDIKTEIPTTLTEGLLKVDEGFWDEYEDKDPADFSNLEDYDRDAPSNIRYHIEHYDMLDPESISEEDESDYENDADGYIVAKASEAAWDAVTSNEPEKKLLLKYIIKHYPSKVRVIRKMLGNEYSSVKLDDSELDNDSFVDAE